MESIIPISTALIAVAGGALVYWNQKRIDRNVDLVSKRREAYGEYLRAYLYTDTKQRQEELNYSRMTISLLASDDVLRAMAELDDYAIETSVSRNRDAEKLAELMTNVVRTMRKDVFEKTDLSEEDLRKTISVR